MPSLNKLTVSIIIPVRNGGLNFSKCLASLSECIPPPEEIIVVADGDSDGSWRMAEEYGMDVLRIPTPGGPAGARNLGAKTAKGDILFFVDADVTVPKDAVNLVNTAFQRDPDLVAVFGSYDDEPFETNFLSQYKNLFHHYVHQTSNREASTFWGACGAIRRKVFIEMGGFDENYRRPSIEDIELGYRLKSAGYRINLLKDLKVKHLKHWGVQTLLKADFFYRALPWTGLILKEGQFPDDLNLTVSSRISVFSAYLLLICLVGVFFTAWSLVPALSLIILLHALNGNLYGFFREKRGIYFALKTIPWHWFYLLYCGLAFATGFAHDRFKRIVSGKFLGKMV